MIALAVLYVSAAVYTLMKSISLYYWTGVAPRYLGPEIIGSCKKISRTSEKTGSCFPVLGCTIVINAVAYSYVLHVAAKVREDCLNVRRKY